MINNVICMKWGTKFSSSYVNRLYEMVKKNLTLPYEFLCFTDDPKGINPYIKIAPIPEMNLDHKGPERGWRKLSVFSNGLGNLSGKALFLDLDIIIKSNIDDFFKNDGDFWIIKDWDFPNDIIGNSSVFRFNINDHCYILEDFIKNSEKIKKNFRNEQAYLSYSVKGNGTLNYWNSDWCVSFKRNCLRLWPLCYFMDPIDPQEAKIIVFHGKPNPEQAYNGYCSKFGFRYIRQTKWLDKYW